MRRLSERGATRYPVAPQVLLCGARRSRSCCVLPNALALVPGGSCRSWPSCAPRPERIAYDEARQRIVLPSWGTTWLYGPVLPATTTDLGSACPGTNGLPLLTSGQPFVGNPNLRIDLVSARGPAACLFGLSAASTSLSLGGGCSLYLKDPIAWLPTITNLSGFGTTTLAIPNDLGLRGARAYLQSFVLDPGAAQGFTASFARSLLLGD